MTLRRQWALALALMLGGTAGTGCGARQGHIKTPPSASIQAYVKALRGDDPRAAYDMLSSAQQREMSFDDFALHWKDHAAERAWQAAALEEGLRDHAELGAHAEVTLASGASVPLERDQGSWRVGAAMVTPGRASRAVDAFRQFAAAVQARDLEALLAVLTERRRAGLAKQLDGFFAGIDGHLGKQARWYEYPDRAELRWSSGGLNYKLIARKDGDVWRIDDIDVTTDDDSNDEDVEDEGDGEDW